MSDPMENIQPILHTHAEIETKEELKDIDLTVSWTQALEASGLSEDEVAKIMNESEPELTDDELATTLTNAIEEDFDEELGEEFDDEDLESQLRELPIKDDPRNEDND